MDLPDPAEMGVAKMALAIVLAGLGGILLGALLSRFSWPLGVAVIGVGFLLITAGPAIAVMAWLRSRPTV